MYLGGGVVCCFGGDGEVVFCDGKRGVGDGVEFFDGFEKGSSWEIIGGRR